MDFLFYEKQNHESFEETTKSENYYNWEGGKEQTLLKGEGVGGAKSWSSYYKI